MKKITLLLALALCLSMLLCACGGEAPVETEPKTTTQAPETQPQETEPQQTQPQNEGLVTYTVKLVDEAGNPIVTGGVVQLCLEACIPNATNDQGTFSWTVAEADYKVSFIKLPEGFTHATEATDYYFEAGSTELTIVLKAA